jgi:hypothetical protein
MREEETRTSSFVSKIVETVPGENEGNQTGCLAASFALGNAETGYAWRRRNPTAMRPDLNKGV